MDGQRHAPGRFASGKQTRYALYRRLGGPRDWSEWARKIPPPPGFEPRTVRPVASRYTAVVVIKDKSVPLQA